MAVDAQHRDRETFGMSKSMATLFHCPTCAAKYEVVGFEAAPGPTTEREVTCLCCGGSLHAREGNFVVTYFLIEGPGQRA
jgi:hypothetical protein